MQAPNQQQIQSFIRLLLGAGGPLAALLVSRGTSADTVNLILTIALAVVPPLISLVWSMFSHSDKATVAAAGALPGVNVVVAPSAPVGARAAAADPAVPGVNPA